MVPEAPDSRSKTVAAMSPDIEVSAHLPAADFLKTDTVI